MKELLKELLLIADVAAMLFVTKKIFQIIINEDSEVPIEYFCIRVANKEAQNKAEVVYVKTNASDAEYRLTEEITRLLDKNHLSDESAVIEINEVTEQEYENSLSKR